MPHLSHIRTLRLSSNTYQFFHAAHFLPREAGQPAYSPKSMRP